LLEPPDIQAQVILSTLQEEYRLSVRELEFLPLGADINTAVFRAVSEEGKAYFLKLRSGDFDEITVTVPRFLAEQGIPAIIAPLEGRTGSLWASLERFKLILYPFVEGINGYKVGLTDEQWRRFGSALRSIHDTRLPESLAQRIPIESYSPVWRDITRGFQSQIETSRYADPVAAELAAYMRSHKQQIDFLVNRTDELAGMLQQRPLERVLCHCDIHPGNLLIGDKDVFFIVDWDNPNFAPKERDLQLIGGSHTWRSAREEALFYEGYGPSRVDQAALAYYRYERIIEDIAAYGQQLLLSTEGGKDREQSLIYFKSNFLPDYEIDIAMRNDILLK
jgi:spectinomycin phosphotransferase